MKNSTHTLKTIKTLNTARVPSAAHGLYTFYMPVIATEEDFINCITSTLAFLLEWVHREAQAADVKYSEQETESLSA